MDNGRLIIYVNDEQYWSQHSALRDSRQDPLWRGASPLDHHHLLPVLKEGLDPAGNRSIYPVVAQLPNKRLYGTVSNALEKSNTAMSIWIFLSLYERGSWRVYVKETGWG